MAEEPFGVLGLDAAAERSTGRLRLVAAAATLAGAIGIALASPPAAGWACAALGLLASLMWVGMWARARRVVRDEERHYLALEPGGLRLSEGASETRVPWDEIDEIEVDEDRLVLQVKRTTGAPVRVEPRYGGLGVHDLEAAVRRACQAARTGRA
jgi:hypothetical protein